MFTRSLGRRAAAMAAILALSLVTAACGEDSPEPTTNENGGDSGDLEVTTVKHALPFPIIPFAAPHIVGVEKGIFEKYGLTVENLPGESGATSVAAVAAGEAEFGHVDFTALTLAKSEDPSIDVIQVYSAYRRPQQSIYSLKSGANIDTPEKVRGATIYTEPGSFNRNIIQGWATDNGLGEIKFEDVDQAARDRLLIAGRIPAIASFLSTRGVLTGAAAENGEELVTLELAEYGLDILTSGISVSKAWAEENPNTVKAYLTALNEAYIYTLENKEEAAEIMSSLYPEFPPEATIGSMEVLEYSMTNDGELSFDEIGTYDVDLVQSTVDFINKNFGTEITPEDLYTSEYVDEIER